MKYPNPQNIFLEKYKAIFLVIQKNACSSVIAQIVEVLDMPKTANFPTDIHSPKHYKYPRLTDEVFESQYTDYLRFCIIRNPWERLVSCYKDKVMNAENNFFWASCSKFRGGMSFEEFVDVVASLSDKDSDPHFSSQLYHILGEDGSLTINYFCNLENLNNHIQEISNYTGIPFKEMEQLNSSKKSSYTDFYTPEILEKVNKRFKGDIEFFKFEFGKKNNIFPFGFVDENIKNTLAQTAYLIPYLREKNGELKSKIVKLNKALHDKQKLILSLHKSISWKISAPFRKISSWFGKKDSK